MWLYRPHELVTPVLLASIVALAACSSDDDDTDGVLDDPDGFDGSAAFTMRLLHFADIDGDRDLIRNVANFYAILEKFKPEYDYTLVLNSGDNWIPGPEYNTATRDELADVLGVPGDGRAHISWLFLGNENE